MVNSFIYGNVHSSTIFHLSTFDDRVSTNIIFPPVHPVLLPIAIFVFRATYSTRFSVDSSFEYTRLICGSYELSSKAVAFGNNRSLVYLTRESNVVDFLILKKMNLKYASPWPNSSNSISGGVIDSNANDGRSNCVEAGIDEVSVIWGGNGGDCGKLAEAGKVVVVNLDSAGAGLNDSGGISHNDKPRSLSNEAMIRMTMRSNRLMNKVFGISDKAIHCNLQLSFHCCGD